MIGEVRARIESPDRVRFLAQSEMRLRRPVSMKMGIQSSDTNLVRYPGTFRPYGTRGTTAAASCADVGISARLDESTRARLLSATRWVFHSYEYLGFRLTGSVTAITNSPETEPTVHLFESLGLESACRPPIVHRPGDVIGLLSPCVARQTGLRGAARGCRNCRLLRDLDRHRDRAWRDPFASPRAHPAASRLSAIGESSTRSGGSARCLIWSAIDGCWRAQCLVAATLLTGSPVNSTCRARRDRGLSEDAASIPAGADGLIALPYLIGERAPINDR